MKSLTITSSNSKRRSSHSSKIRPLSMMTLIWLVPSNSCIQRTQRKTLIPWIENNKKLYLKRHGWREKNNSMVKKMMTIFK